MTKTGTKRPRDGVAGSSATPVNTPPSAGATNPGHSRRISPPLKTRSQVSPGANIVGGRNMQSPPKKNLEHGSPAGHRIPTKHTYKRRKSIAHKSDKPTGLMMPRTSNVGNPQHQVTEEHSAKSVDEETDSDSSDFVILHKVPHVHKGKHPRCSFQNSKSEIGGPSSRTRGKTTGCNPTNIPDKAMRDKVEGAGKGKVRVDVTEMAMKDKDKAAVKGKMRVDEAEKDPGNTNPKPEPKLCLRSRCALKKIKDVVGMPGMHASRLLKLESLRFFGTTPVRLGSLCLDFLKWAFECYDVNTKTFHFKKTDRLRITEGDVFKVYGLPRGNKSVAKKIAEFKNSDVSELGVSYGLDLDNSPMGKVLHSVLQRRLENEVDGNKWKKLMIVYIISVLLCPKERLQASLKFLPLLDEDCIGEFTKYNWCKYVVDHFHNGFKAAKQNKEKKGTAAMFIGADINLLMVCFCEKYGISSLNITPLCARWDNKMFKDTATTIRYEGGNTFPEELVEEDLKLPRPFKGILANLANGWGDREAYEQERIMEWLQMVKGVIEGEIQIVKDSMELKMEEDKATQAERQEQEDNDDSIEVNSNQDQQSDDEAMNTISS
ncbi:hypothetical protein LINPERPRIM_LOCUS39257 [Linum perenne]